MICEAFVKTYCKDFTKIENYEKAIADSDKWDCHHRLELDGVVPLSRAELIGLELYYDRPPEELIFLRHNEHIKLHHKGKIVSSETKRKMADAHKNISEETKRKMSEAHKGQSPGNKGKHCSEELKKKLSDSHKGKHWKLVVGKRVYY